MCRILCVKSEREFAAAEHLRALAAIARDSKEYQGHGWGCAWRDGAAWRLYRCVRPIWEDDLSRFPSTTLLVAHARSAFRDEGIRVFNNMPFFDGRRVFVFNGELRGVRIREAGRIGAEKVFNYVKRFDRGDLGAALARGLDVIERRSRYVRAMNVIAADGGRVWASCRFAEDPDYFRLRERRRPGEVVVCSEPYPGEDGWTPLPVGTVEAR